MKVSEKTIISTRKLECLPNNPRKIMNESLNRLCDSIRNNGYWEHRPAAVEPIEGTDRYYVLDGNQRLKALRRLKRYEMPCVIYTELTEAERDDIILRSNVNNGEWDVPMLQAEFEQVDFEAIGLDIELPDIEPIEPITTSPSSGKVPPRTDDTEPTPQGDEDDAPDSPEKMSLYFRMLGDYVYPSNNEFDIHTLLTDNMPVHLELPLNPWGAEARYKKGITTYHFYVDDYRFEALYKDPIKLLESGCRAVVEPNNSIHDQTPAAYAIWQIYRKRYLARYLQECGLQVWVDLNVSPKFEQLNAKGIPQGYNAFFTRGVSGWQPTLDRHLLMAQRISGLEHPNLCVYGGGDDIRQWCHEKGVLHVQEYMNNRMREKGK